MPDTITTQFGEQQITDIPNLPTLTPETRAGVYESIIEESFILSNFDVEPVGSLEVQILVQNEIPEARFTTSPRHQKHISTQEIKDVKAVMAEVTTGKAYRNSRLRQFANRGIDLLERDRALFGQSLGIAVDHTITFEDTPPDDWSGRPSLFSTATANNAVVTPSGDTFVDLFGANGVLSKIEKSGYRPDLLFTSSSFLPELRMLQNPSGQYIFWTDPAGTMRSTLNGIPIVIVNSRAWDDSKAKFMAINRDLLRIMVFEEMTFEVNNSGVLNDADGKITDNLLQENKTAILAWMWLTWQLLTPVTAKTSSAQRTPVSFLGVGGEEPITP